LLEAPEDGVGENLADEVDTGNLAVNLAQSDTADVDIENTSENTSEITSENSAENNVRSRPVKAKSGGGKMSKSSGEFVTLDVLVAKGYSAMDYRYFCLTAHYRNYLRFGYAALDGARESLRSLRKKTDPLLGKSAALETEKALAWREQFLSAVCDDLNFPQALGVVNLFLKDEDLSDGEKSALIELCDGLLGLGLCEPPAVESLPADLLTLIEDRRIARATKDWKRSDEIRDLFLARGYKLLDRKDGGTEWEKI
jgi:cysteinyl-tRNA synthetase